MESSGGLSDGVFALGFCPQVACAPPPPRVPVMKLRTVAQPQAFYVSFGRVRPREPFPRAQGYSHQVGRGILRDVTARRTRASPADTPSLALTRPAGALARDVRSARGVFRFRVRVPLRHGWPS